MKTWRGTGRTGHLLLAMALVTVMAAAFPQAAFAGMVSFFAAADDRSGAWDGSVDISWYTKYEDPSKVTDFYVETPAQLAGLAYIVNGRLDTKQFPLKYKANKKKTGLYDKTTAKNSAGKKTTFYVLNSKHKGTIDVDVAKTVDKVIDGSEATGRTASGLKAEDFWVTDPTYIQLTGGGGGNTWDQIYTGYQKYDFLGQTVHITADLDMGGRYDSGKDSWSGSNWTPIGGRYSMDSYTAGDFRYVDVVTISTSFNGSLDGGGHTLSHMYCDRYTAKGFEYSQGVALVGQFGELYDSMASGYGHSRKAEISPEGYMPTVSNLSIGDAGGSDASRRGYIYGRRMVGGVVGLVGAIPDGVLVENCANFATLGSCDSKGIGGIVGSGWGRGLGTIRNCYNRGNITATYSECPAGGICGANSMNIYNCYNTGQIKNTAGSGTNIRASGIGRHDSGTYTVDNCYSLEGSFQDTSNDGYWLGTSTTVIANVYVRQSGTSDKGAGLKDKAFLEEINANAGQIYVADGSGAGSINEGYPILFWQAAGASSKGGCTITVDSISDGAVTVEVPRMKQGENYSEVLTLQPGQSTSVPYGTVVTLRAEANLPKVLEHFTAGGKPLRANYYVATDSSTLGASFIQLQQGKITILADGSVNFGISKNGTTLNSAGRAVKVSNYPVKDGDTVFENDQLMYRASLKKGAKPSDKNLEYSGAFTYRFSYGGSEVRTAQTQHRVSRSIGSGGLQVQAEPATQNKQWTSIADTSWYRAGAPKKAYTITTARQLAGLAKLVNSGVSFQGTTLTLGNDISLDNADGTMSTRYWTGIGISAKSCFAGTFDGKGHTISGMQAYSSGGTAALFGYCKGAVIRNLTVRGTAQSIGLTAGVAANVNGGSLENCVNEVTVSSSSKKDGGLVAELTNKGKIKNCRNKGPVSGTDSVGGIVGATDASGIQITNCANYGTVTGTGGGSGTATGGICGYLGGLVDRSANFGAVVSANSYVGGIAGHTWANTKAKDKDSSKITNAFNRGQVEASAANARTAAGGLIGYGQYILMNNCYNAGSVSLAYTGSNPHQGLLIGYFYKSIYNSIQNTYYTGSGSTIVCRDNKNAALEGQDISKQPLSYVKITAKSETDLASPAFASTLNAQAKNAFTAVTGDFVQLTWITKLQECTVTYQGDYNETDRTYYGGSVRLPHAEDGGVYRFADVATGAAWTGQNITADVTVQVVRETVTEADAIFLADGAEVYRITFSSSDKYIADPLPDAESYAHRDGYTVRWSEADMGGAIGTAGNYWSSSHAQALGTEDIVVNAVYEQAQLPVVTEEEADGVISSSARIASDGYYFLKPETRGTVTVASGVKATLDGSNGPFTNLRVVVEAGATLTLHDVDLNTDAAELGQPGTEAGAVELRGGSGKSKAAVLQVSGYSRVYGNNDGFNLLADGTRDTDTKYPAVMVSGYGIIRQAGDAADTLHIQAYKDNPEVDITRGATLEIAGGIVEVYRSDRLGAQGGMIYGTDYSYSKRAATGAQNGNLTVSGGTLIAVSDTNNVFAFCVNKYTQSGGSVICYAAEAETASSTIDKSGSGLDRAVFATSMKITGGSLRAGSRTHQDNTSDPVYYYYNGDAIRCGANTGNKLTKQYFLYALDLAGHLGGTCKVTVDGKTYYRGPGNLVDYTYGSGDNFITDPAQADQTLYLWIPKTGKSHRISVNGKVVDKTASEKNPVNNRYTVKVSGKNVSITFLDGGFVGKTAEVKLLNKKGKKLQAKKTKLFSKKKRDRTVTFTMSKLPKAKALQVAVYQNGKSKKSLVKVVKVKL